MAESPVESPAVPDIVFVNADVLTLDAAGNRHDAIAVGGERIVAVGREADLLATADARTQRIDAAGRLLTPGLIDGHAHMDCEGLKDMLPSLAGAESIDEVLGEQQRISREEALAAASREGAWLGFDERDRSTLEPGKFADIAVWDRNLLTVGHEELRHAQAYLTMTGRRVVHGPELVP